MDIKKIKDPKFLKKLKIKDLEMLSNDIRKYIIDSVYSDEDEYKQQNL